MMMMVGVHVDVGGDVAHAYADGAVDVHVNVYVMLFGVDEDEMPKGLNKMYHINMLCYCFCYCYC